MTVNNVLGVDLGFVQLKAVGHEWSTKFSSIVKARSTVAVNGLADSEGYLVGYKNQAYNVGAKGSYDFNADRLTRDTDVAKLLAVLGLQDSGVASVVPMLVTGLPVEDFNLYKDTVKETLEQRFQYEFGGVKRLTTVAEVQVIPQSAGAYYDYILTEDGEVNENVALASENVLVLDIGGKTSDGCIMEASKYSQASFTIRCGVWEAQKELTRLIAKEYRYALKPFEVDKVMRSKKLRLGSVEHDVTDYVATAVATVYQGIRDDLSLHIEDFRRYSAVLLAGGGAHVFYECLDADIACPIILMENAEFANASGYRKYGLLLMKEKTQ